MVQSGLVGWWPLSEWDGRANDLSGSGMNGTVSGATQGVAGRGGLTGYSFIEADDISSSYNGPVNPDAISVSVWARPDSNTEDLGYEAILQNSRGMGTGGGSVQGFSVGLRELNLRATVGDGSNGTWLASGTTIKAGNWYHLTYNIVVGSHISGYVNGTLLGTEDLSSVTGDIIDESDNIFIAGENSDNGRSFSGDLSDVRFYNRALSQSEIQHLYKQGTVDVATPPDSSDSGAVARYAFDDPSDTGTAIDSWGSNNGSIAGATYSSNSIEGLSIDIVETDDNVSTPLNANFGTNPFTVSAWFNTRNLSGDFQYIVSTYDGNNGFVLDKDNQDNIRFWVNDNPAIEPDLSIGEDSWYHAVGVAEQDVAKLYVNGSIVGSDTRTGNVDSTESVTIGNTYDNGNELDGYIDDVRIYDRALSDREVQQLYQWGTKGVDMRSKLTQH
jgi:hypothetical protein